MDVSIIIVNYNTSQLLKNCINSVIEKTNGISYEIIIVDNGSSDNSVSMVKQNFPYINIIESKENLGYGRANNIGAKAAIGKYLLLLNTDVLLINNAIKIFYDFMEQESNTDIAACGGNLFKSNLEPNFSYSLFFPTPISTLVYRFHLSSLFKREYFNKSGIIKDVAFIVGADLFIRKKVFDDVDGFDPLFFMYVEEGDLQYRIHKDNYRIVSIPNAHIVHLQGKSSENFLRLRMEITSYAHYYKKHMDKLNLLFYLYIEILSALTRMALFLVLLKIKKVKEYISLISYIHTVKRNTL